MNMRTLACLFSLVGCLPIGQVAAAADAPASKPAEAKAASPKAAETKAPAKAADTKPADPKPTTAAPAKPVAPAPAKTVASDDATVPLNREGARHQLINDRAKAGDVDLLFIGDSITQGWEGAGKDVWAKFYGNRKAMNAGIGGDRTQHVLWRLENGNIEGIKPKAAVIMIGTNNSGSNTSEQIADGVKAIVAKLRKELPEMKILVLGIFPRGADKSDVRRQVNEGANQLIQAVADGGMVQYLDIGNEFLEEDGTLSKDIMPDLLHLSPTGYEIWAEAIDAKVAEMLGETQVVPATGSAPRRGPGLLRRLRNRL